MSYPHAVVWMDHFTARVIGFGPDDQQAHTVHSHAASERTHTKSSPGSGHAADDPHFFDAIIGAVGGTREVLIGGPGLAKTAFEKYVGKRHPAFAKRIVAVESFDHPTDGELVAHARKSFKSIDQMIGDA